MDCATLIYALHVSIWNGSLRKYSSRGYNIDRFGEQKYIKDVFVKGFDMYSLGAYPTIIKGNGTIKCELHTIENEPFEKIYTMEINSGYKEKKIKIDNVKASIFYMDGSAADFDKTEKVESGDWD